MLLVIYKFARDLVREFIQWAALFNLCNFDFPAEESTVVEQAIFSNNSNNKKPNSKIGPWNAGNFDILLKLTKNQVPL